VIIVVLHIEFERMKADKQTCFGKRPIYEKFLPANLCAGGASMRAVAPFTEKILHYRLTLSCRSPDIQQKWVATDLNQVSGPRSQISALNFPFMDIARCQYHQTMTKQICFPIKLTCKGFTLPRGRDERNRGSRSKFHSK